MEYIREKLKSKKVLLAAHQGPFGGNMLFFTEQILLRLMLPVIWTECFTCFTMLTKNLISAVKSIFRK